MARTRGYEPSATRTAEKISGWRGRGLPPATYLLIVSGSAPGRSVRGDKVLANLGLAGELFLIGHNEYSGKLKINSEMLSCGLAAAALGELLLAGALTIDKGRLVSWTARQSGDTLTDLVVAELQRIGGGHPAHSWIEHLRERIKEVVAHRLAKHGVIRIETARTLTGRMQTRFVANDPIEASRPAVRLSFLLGQGPLPLDPHSALLSALTTAIGIELVIPTISSRLVRDRLAGVRASLPAAHADLVKGVETAVATVALSARG